MPLPHHCLRALAVIALGALSIVTSAHATVNVGGRIQLDAALYDEDTTELESGTNLRSLRLLAAADLNEQWAYKANLEFAGGDVAVRDVFVSYSGLSFGILKIGNFKTPFSLEELDSSKYITFMERAMINTFAPSHRVGIGVDHISGRTTIRAAVFGNEAQSSGNNDEGVGLAARVTTAPKLTADSFVHIGASFALEEPSGTGGTASVRYRARPESNVTDQRLVDGGQTSDVNDITSLGLEAAYVARNFSAKAEYIKTTVSSSVDDADYDGYYVYASYFPWGGSRPYRNGQFGRVDTSDVWEFAVRYSNIDLSDTGGGEQNNITFGANYYITTNLRFMANYVLTDVDNGINGDESPDIFQIRLSMEF